MFRELAEVMTQLWEDPDLQHCYSRFVLQLKWIYKLLDEE